MGMQPYLILKLLYWIIKYFCNYQLTPPDLATLIPPPLVAINISSFSWLSQKGQKVAT